MNLTKRERSWLADIKSRCIADYNVSMIGRTRFDGDGLDEGYKNWQTWQLCEMVERLARKGG